MTHHVQCAPKKEAFFCKGQKTFPRKQKKTVDINKQNKNTRVKNQIVKFNYLITLDGLIAEMLIAT